MRLAKKCHLACMLGFVRLNPLALAYGQVTPGKGSGAPRECTDRAEVVRLVQTGLWDKSDRQYLRGGKLNQRPKVKVAWCPYAGNEWNIE